MDMSKAVDMNKKRRLKWKKAAEAFADKTEAERQAEYLRWVRRTIFSPHPLIPKVDTLRY
jgi:hypothetical protein